MSSNTVSSKSGSRSFGLPWLKYHWKLTEFEQPCCQYPCVGGTMPSLVQKPFRPDSDHKNMVAVLPRWCSFELEFEPDDHHCVLKHCPSNSSCGARLEERYAHSLLKYCRCVICIKRDGLDEPVETKNTNDRFFVRFHFGCKGWKWVVWSWLTIMPTKIFKPCLIDKKELPWVYRFSPLNECFSSQDILRPEPFYSNSCAILSCEPSLCDKPLNSHNWGKSVPFSPRSLSR